jgi:hypothetical protein
LRNRTLGVRARGHLLLVTSAYAFASDAKNVQQHVQVSAQEDHRNERQFQLHSPFEPFARSGTLNALSKETPLSFGTGGK